MSCQELCDRRSRRETWNMFADQDIDTVSQSKESNTCLFYCRQTLESRLAVDLPKKSARENKSGIKEQYCSQVSVLFAWPLSIAHVRCCFRCTKGLLLVCVVFCVVCILSQCVC